jgi:hypothetical protein
LSLREEYRPLLNRIEIRFLSASGLAILIEHFAFLPECVCWGILDCLLHPPPPSGWTSAIVPDFPTLFEDFMGKQFTLLWRGSRDGFGYPDFHRRCDGHPNTLTVILDTNGNIFGGFTPVEWESTRIRNSKADPSLKSFLFTLKNPHNFPPRRFALKADQSYRAVYHATDWGPHFSDIGVSDSCNTNTVSHAHCFGSAYTNNTGLGGHPGVNAFLTNPSHFQVKEIEVFEITN